MADPENFVGALARAFPMLSTEVFAIRSPEVRVLGGPWTANTFHDGSTVRGNDTLRLVGDLLKDPRFWCELESDGLEVHVSEDAVYLGTSPNRASVMTAQADLDVAVVPDSPYSQDDVDAVRYRPATADFWGDLDALLQSRGSLLLVSQWAGGLGGEQWYLLQSSTDVLAARAGVVPRSIIAAFEPERYIRIDDSSPVEVEGFVGSEAVYGNLRWLTPDSGSRLDASVVNDELDLREKCKIPKVGAVLFCWPETDMSGCITAACPDVDGVVRTLFRFE
ncbi:hypothetical protein [Micromonospora sp. NBC_00858]|uniref:hypothetical protein n=1 Tax=Micromonospora sp. NBC_00858 TaxID=2975979 RepID=UPI003863BBC5|nr:hypothetical protein OG990_35430 [Micromonospora sp. NBC_00858]